MVGAFLFPRFWYRLAAGDVHWFAESRTLPGWSVSPVPLSEAAEAQVGAHTWVSARFGRTDGAEVTVFCAKRYGESWADVAPFAHTPDRCWTIAGWKIEPAEPEVQETMLSSIPVRFERRLFRGGNRSELVYFGAILGGRPVPFRLDQYLSFGRRMGRSEDTMATEAYRRAGDARFWACMWNCFRNRLSFNSAAHFIRVSTPVSTTDLASSDRLLQEFLRAFLVPTDYAAEAREWRAKRHKKGVG
jgi:hypothetical protein